MDQHASCTWRMAVLCLITTLWHVGFREDVDGQVYTQGRIFQSDTINNVKIATYDFNNRCFESGGILVLPQVSPVLPPFGS
jgi:hypothetical protein